MSSAGTEISGPWSGEPDRAEFKHAGHACLLLRGPMGAWCGYVAVPPGHPLHGKEYADVDLYVHGGLSYSGACDGKICHVPDSGEPDNVWWFGFDCAHAGDMVPRLLKYGGAGYGVYRNQAYATCETKQLAEQIAKKVKR